MRKKKLNAKAIKNMKHYLSCRKKFKNLAEIEEYLAMAKVPGFEKIGELELTPFTIKRLYNIKAQTSEKIKVSVFIGDLDYIGYDGFCENTAPQYIFLNMSQSKVELKYTLFHEILHLILTLHNVLLKSNMDERLVREIERLSIGCFYSSPMHYAGEEKRRNRQSANEKIKYIQKVIKNINNTCKKGYGK